MLMSKLQDITSANKVTKTFLKDMKKEMVDIQELLKLALDMVIMHLWL